MPRITSEPSRRTLVATSLSLGGLALALQAIPARGQERSRPMEATISAGAAITTLINVFAVEPERQQELIDALQQGTDAFFSKMPGFISSSVLSGTNGRQVINYSQWRSRQDVAAFRQDPRFAPYIQRLAALARGETIECAVAYVNRA
jgi:heme-degrading monooxygenase HmoA